MASDHGHSSFLKSPHGISARDFYKVASAPFAEIKRKINCGEASFEPHLAKYEDEPPFTMEWIEAERCLEVLGRVCISMLSASLKLYFDTWRAHLGIELQSQEKHVLKKHGVLKDTNGSSGRGWGSNGLTARPTSLYLNKSS